MDLRLRILGLEIAWESKGREEGARLQHDIGRLRFGSERVHPNLNWQPDRGFRCIQRIFGEECRRLGCRAVLAAKCKVVLEKGSRTSLLRSTPAAYRGNRC